MPTLETSRSEIHALVWSKPTRDCAEQLGISDTGLAKLCTRNDVIRPPNGYWLRKHQRKVPPPLKGKDRKIAVYQRETLPRSELSEPIVAIPDVPAGRRFHREVVQCRTALTGAKADEYGRLVSQRRDMQVSSKSLARALSLMNQIIRIAAILDCTIATRDNRIELTGKGETIALWFYERATQTSEKINRGAYTYTRRTYAPSGHLKFSLSGDVGLYGIQHEWNDRPNKPLESKLPEIMRGIIRGFDHIRERRLDDNEQARLYGIRRLREQRLVNVAKLAAERQQRVDKLIANYQRSKDIATVMDEIEFKGTAPSAKDRRLIRWARELARHYDPLDAFSIDVLKS